jgi:hypothetical protein
MRKRTPQRAMGFALFIAAISLFNFSRISGGECIRVVHIITLLTCGAALGVFLSNFFILIRTKEDKKDL